MFFYIEFWQSSITFLSQFLNSMFFAGFKKEKEGFKQNRKVSEERGEWWLFSLFVIILRLLNGEKKFIHCYYFDLFAHGPVSKKPRVTFLEIPKQE